MLNLIIIVAIVSLLLALFSLRDYKGEKQTNKIKANLNKEKIKGGIVLNNKKETTHYSSYS